MRALNGAVEDLPARAVLTSEVTRDAVDDAMVAGGWRLTNVLPAAPARPSQLIFSRPRATAFGYVIDDHQLGVTYLSVQGRDALAHLAALRAALPCHGPLAHESMLDEGFAEGDEDRIALGLTLVALQVPPSDRVDAWLLEGLNHSALRVRSVAVTAASYQPRPALIPALLSMSQNDPEPALRRVADEVLGLCGGGR